MKSMGYRHMAAFLNNEIDWDEAVRILKRDHRRYAKRQMTWFRADPGIVWLEPEDIEGAGVHIKACLFRLEQPQDYYDNATNGGAQPE